MFSAFKIGEARYAYPFAAGVHAALAARGVTECDAIVPIPLSPEKIEKDELDRTGALAVELAALMSTKVSPLLSLSAPISKRRMQLQGFTPTQFKQKYRQLLEVDPDVAKLEKIVLLDDVITQGSTLSVAVAAIKEVAPAIDIVVASAGQMILRAVVADVNGPAW